MKDQKQRINGMKMISLDALSAEQEPQEVPYDDGKEHPTPEQIMVRQAVKYLTPKQKRVWELYNYDKLTQDEIAKKLGQKRTTIEGHIHRCEARIAKWCKMNMGAYNLIKTEMER